MSGTLAQAPDAFPAIVAEAAKPQQVEIIGNIAERWDTLAAQFADVCLEQTGAYMLSRWGSSRLCGLVLRDAASGELEALALAVMAALPFIEAGLAYVKFGPLWRPKGRHPRPETLSAALRAMEAEFCRERGLLLRMMPPADPEHGDAWKRSMDAVGFRLRQPMPHPERYLVDLRLGESEQLASLGAKWRANLRKASPTLRVEEVAPAEALPQFLALYGAMTARKRFVDHHRIAQVPAFVAAAPSSLGLRVFLAYAGTQPVAASLVAGSGERVFVPYSASTAEALPLRAGYALRWHIMKELRGSGAKWLDLGGHEGDDGLRHFKAGNVGTRGATPSIPGEFELGDNGLSLAAVRGIEWARGASARWRLAFAGA